MEKATFGEEFDLEKFFDVFNGLVNIETVPGDGKEPKYWVIYPLASDEPKFIVERGSSTQDQDVSIHQFVERIVNNKFVVAQAIQVRNLNDIPSGCFLNAEEYQILKLLENDYTVRCYRGDFIITGETRVSPRLGEGGCNTILEFQKVAPTEERIREVYSAVIQYFYQCEKKRSVRSVDEFVGSREVDELISQLELTFNKENELNISLNSTLKGDLSKRILELKDVKNMEKDPGKISKLKAFALQSTKQLKHLCRGIQSLKSLKNLDLDLGIKNSDLVVFWLKNIFFPGFANFQNWTEGELSFFQGRHLALDERGGISRIYLNYLEPTATLPMYSTIFRVALDGYKAYTKEELDDKIGFDSKTRLERLNYFMREIQSLPGIDLVQFTKTRIFIMFMTLLDILNDAASEIGDVEARFTGLENGLERYKVAVKSCLEILKSNLWGEKTPDSTGEIESNVN